MADDVDFGITIEFVRGESDPVQVFQTMTELLVAFKNIDDVLINAVAVNIETNTVIEKVEAQSITAWIKNKLKATNDEAIKELNWKKQIGSYAVKAKYKIIEFLDEKESNAEAKRLKTLGDDLETLGFGVNNQIVRPTIDLQKLARPLDQVQKAKKILSRNEVIIIKTNNSSHRLNRNVTKQVSTALDDNNCVSESKIVEMNLLVRKPDFIGRTQWEFKCNDKSLFANMEDEKWLEQFQTRQVVLHPGSSISASVECITQLDKTGITTNSEYNVIKVHKISTPLKEEQIDFFD